MALTDKESNGFKNLINKTIKPLVEEHGDDIIKFVKDNPELKDKVVDKVGEIIKNRKEKN